MRRSSRRGVGVFAGVLPLLVALCTGVVPTAPATAQPASAPARLPSLEPTGPAPRLAFTDDTDQLVIEFAR